MQKLFNIKNYMQIVLKTGEKAILNFKLRNWSGKNAYEANGYVMDSNG